MIKRLALQAPGRTGRLPPAGSRFAIDRSHPLSAGLVLYVPIFAGIQGRGYPNLVTGNMVTPAINNPLVISAAGRTVQSNSAFNVLTESSAYLSASEIPATIALYGVIGGATFTNGLFGIRQSNNQPGLSLEAVAGTPRYTYTSGTSAVISASPAVIDALQPACFMGTTRSASEHELFYNGVSNGTSTTTVVPILARDRAIFGQTGGGNGRSLLSSVFAFWRRGLSADEAKAFSDDPFCMLVPVGKTSAGWTALMEAAPAGVAMAGQGGSVGSGVGIAQVGVQIAGAGVGAGAGAGAGAAQAGATLAGAAAAQGQGSGSLETQVVVRVEGQGAAQGAGTGTARAGARIAGSVASHGAGVGSLGTLRVAALAGTVAARGAGVGDLLATAQIAGEGVAHGVGVGDLTTPAPAWLAGQGASLGGGTALLLAGSRMLAVGYSAGLGVGYFAASPKMAGEGGGEGDGEGYLNASRPQRPAVVVSVV